MNTAVQKDYLTYELDRNTRARALFERIIKISKGSGCTVLVRHHIEYQPEGSTQVIEIPSADTLLGDYDIMGDVFGDQAPDVIRTLFSTPVERRDELAKHFLDDIEAQGREAVAPIVVHEAYGIPAIPPYTTAGKAL